MARRAKGDGTLRKRKDGRWEGWFNISKDENGKIIRKSVTAKTKTECREKLNAAKEKYLPDDITINGYDFSSAKSSEEYDEASKEIDREYSEHHLPIILVKKFGKLEAVIEIVPNRSRERFWFFSRWTAYLSMKDRKQIKEPKCGNEELYNAYKLFCERNSLNMQFKYQP